MIIRCSCIEMIFLKYQQEFLHFQFVLVIFFFVFFLRLLCSFKDTRLFNQLHITEREREKKIIIVDMYIVISSSSIEWVRHRGKGRLDYAGTYFSWPVGGLLNARHEKERKTDVAIFSISTQITKKFVLRPTDKRSLLIVALLDYLIGQPVKREREKLRRMKKLLNRSIKLCAMKQIGSEEGRYVSCTVSDVLIS